VIHAQEISPAAFAPFGRLARSGAGELKRIRDNRVLLTRTDTEFPRDELARDFALDFYEVPAEAHPLRMTVAERHPHSCQIFVPVTARRYLVVVWPAKPAPGATPEAFVAGARDVIVYNPGVWHHGIVALDNEATFASAMWRAPEGRDTEFCELPEPLSVSWPEPRR